jgi:dihydrofolate reductase
MGTLTAAMFMTIDGYTQTLSGEMIPPAWSGDLQQHWSGANAHPGQLLLYGRSAFEFNAGFWTQMAIDPKSSAGQRALAETMNDLPKVVVSDSLENPGWNATVESGPLPEVVQRVRSRFDGEIVAVGGVKLVSSLVKGGLVDQYRFLLMPRIAGSGISIFDGDHPGQDLELISQKTMDTGAVILEYRPRRTE